VLSVPLYSGERLLLADQRRRLGQPERPKIKRGQTKSARRKITGE
jgi:hypothetical protein